jgi:hypothetical protein
MMPSVGELCLCRSAGAHEPASGARLVSFLSSGSNPGAGLSPVGERPRRGAARRCARVVRCIPWGSTQVPASLRWVSGAAPRSALASTVLYSFNQTRDQAAQT